MPMSPYLAGLRAHVGHALLMVPGVAAVVRDDEGRVLIQQRTDTGDVELPAGASDPGETPAQAVVREVYEETGLVVRPMRLIAVFGGREFRFTYPTGDVVEYTVAYFECRVVRGTLGSRDGEAHSARFVAIEEAHGRAAERLARVRDALRAGSAGAAFEWDDAWLAIDSATR